MPLEDQTAKFLDKISNTLDELSKIVYENVNETKSMRKEITEQRADMVIQTKEQKELYDGLYKNGLDLRIKGIEEKQRDQKNFIYALAGGIILTLIGLVFK